MIGGCYGYLGYQTNSEPGKIICNFANNIAAAGSKFTKKNLIFLLYQLWTLYSM